MTPKESTFEFFGHTVEVQLIDHGARWSWVYSIDGGRAVRMSGPAIWSEHRAHEDAGMEARDAIRAMRQAALPRWLSAGPVQAIRSEQNLSGNLRLAR